MLIYPPIGLHFNDAILRLSFEAEIGKRRVFMLQLFKSAVAGEIIISGLCIPDFDVAWFISEVHNLFGQGPQRIIFSVLVGRRQNYELNSRDSSIKPENIYYLFN